MAQVRVTSVGAVQQTCSCDGLIANTQLPVSQADSLEGRL